ncbi:Aminomethyltransferase [Thalictrum thalictroides]|uniref:Aminomethyltransferase n=1 Tax=Thalictrum thalictroides TaxID=46969 RepID=A0A7J6VLM0_THATH|nr:Aminomethyltransferase [Thalictrum thalictroides]
MATMTIPLCFSFSTARTSTCITRKLPCCSSYSSSSLSHQLHYFHYQLQTKARKSCLLFSTSSTSSSSSPIEFDLSPPSIDLDLLDTMKELGAEKISEDGVVETFGNDHEAIQAAYNGVAVVDLSHFGRIRVTGDDRIQFLHNQTTANFEGLSEGKGCDTVFVTPTARTIDIAHAWVMVMEDLNLGELVGQPYGRHQHYSVNGTPVTIGVGSVIAEDGFSLLLSPATAGSVWKTLLAHGAVPMGATAWERFRVVQGRPAPGKELSDEFNVLEAGLWNAVSLNKGCYKGQETIARLITYDGVKQKLYGIELSAPAEPGYPITIDGKKVGKLTSYAVGKTESEHFGLGYIKKKTASAGDKVLIGDTMGTLVEVPYLVRQTPLTKSSIA